MMNSLQILAMAAAAVQQSEHLEALPGIHIRKPRPEDIPLLTYVERSAAELFRTAKLDFLVEGPTVNPRILNAMARANHLWIAANKFDNPIGFLGGDYLDGNFHIIEISVAKEYQGKGIGKALMMAMVQQVWMEGFKAVTLTTYRHLPWNAPWYARMGFSETDAQKMGSSYEEILEDEARHGMDLQKRCIMRMAL